MRILHAYCLNYNVGDYALGIGLKCLMRKYLSVDFIGDTNLQGRVFNRYYINEVVNKKYDLLVIGGGGIIHGKHWPNGWFWLIDIDLIKDIKIPFIVYGVGNNYWNEELPMDQKTIDHLNETKRLSTFFSVRNDGSYERLKSQTNIEAAIVPDPGFHVNLIEDYQAIEKRPYVIVQVAYDKPEYRFGQEERGINFVDSMRQVVKYLSEKYTVVFAPHVFDDVLLSEHIAREINNTVVYKFSDYAFDRSERVVGFYKYAEFVLSMRGHGQIIPISFNTPVVALANHPKHTGLMENLNLSKFSISIHEDDFLEKTLYAIRQMETNKDKIKETLRRLNKKLMFESETAFKIIADQLR